MSGASLSTAPTCFYTRIESHLFRLLLLRRLRLLLPPCVPVLESTSNQHWTLEDSRLWQKAFLSFRRVQLALDTTLVSPSMLTALRGLEQLSLTE